MRPARRRHPLRRVTKLTDGRRLVVVPAEVEDGPELGRLYRSVLAEGRYFITAAGELPLDPDWMTDVVQQCLDRDHCTFLVGFLGDILVGAVTVRGGDLQRTRHVGRLEVFVHAAHRGGGVGAALMAAVIDEVRGLPALDKLSLAVFADNERAVELYRRLGFLVEGRRVGEYREADGQLRDDLLMWLPVSERSASALRASQARAGAQ